MGKAVGEVAGLCRKYDKKCIVISGLVRDADQLRRFGIYRAYRSSDYAPSMDESITNAEKYIAFAAEDAAREIVF